MRELDKPSEGDADDSSSINRLPDEIILQILNKVIDLKSLCFCYLVSRRFSSIVLQVDAISFTAPLLNLHKNTEGDVHASMPVLTVDSSFYRESLKIPKMFLSKFKRVKSLCLELPSSSKEAIQSRCLYKWKVKFGTKIELFTFMSPNSVSDKYELCPNGTGVEEVNESMSDMFVFKQNIEIACNCLLDVMRWRILLLDLVKNLPMLERVSITDQGRRGRISVSGKKLSELKEWLHSASVTRFDREFDVGSVTSVSRCYIPVLKLPVSRYVMKGVTLIVIEVNGFQGGIENYDLMKSEDGIEDKEEAAYSEALMEILEKHSGMIHIIPLA